MGSPSRVPVPCASTTSTSAGDSRAFANACVMTRCWEGPLGAVRPFEAPSWLMAEPLMTARTRWPWRGAAVAAGVKQPLQQHQADAIGEAGAVGVREERFAAAVR